MHGIKAYGKALTGLGAGVTEGARKCIDLLLQAGADPFLQDSEGHDAFTAAAQYGGVDVLRQVLLAGRMHSGSGGAVASPAAAARTGPTLPPAAGATSGLAVIHHDLGSRLRDGVQSMATYRTPHGMVWSPATAEVRSSPCPAAAVESITLSVVKSANVSRLWQLPGHRLDEVVALLLGEGAVPSAVEPNLVASYALWVLHVHDAQGEWHRLLDQFIGVLELLQPLSPVEQWMSVIGVVPQLQRSALQLLAEVAACLQVERRAARGSSGRACKSRFAAVDATLSRVEALVAAVTGAAGAGTGGAATSASAAGRGSTAGGH